MNFAKQASSNGHSTTISASSTPANLKPSTMSVITPASAATPGGSGVANNNQQQQRSVKLVIRSKVPGATPKYSTGSGSTSVPPVGTPLEVLEQELPPRVFADQVPLESIIDRMVQDAYARLVELSDTYVSNFRTGLHCYCCASSYVSCLAL